MALEGKLLNFIDSEWRASKTEQFLEVLNPATAKVMFIHYPSNRSEEVGSSRNC
jgi:hypothetical protein